MKPDRIEITVNGQVIHTLFRGTNPVRTNDVPRKSGEVTYRNVMVASAGPVSVQVVATVAGRACVNIFTWTVRRMGTGQARNLILFISKRNGLSDHYRDADLDPGHHQEQVRRFLEHGPHGKPGHRHTERT